MNQWLQPFGEAREAAAGGGDEIDRHRHEAGVAHHAHHALHIEGREDHLVTGLQVESLDQQVEPRAHRISNDRIVRVGKKALDRAPQALAVVRLAETDVVALESRRDLREIVVDEVADQLAHAGAVVALGHEIGRRLERRQRVRDRHAALG